MGENKQKNISKWKLKNVILNLTKKCDISPVTVDECTALELIHTHNGYEGYIHFRPLKMYLFVCTCSRVK